MDKGLSTMSKIDIIILVVVVIAAALFLVPLMTESPPAVLVVESDTVEVGEGDFRQVSGEVRLSEGATVRTGPGADASIVFFGSDVLRIDENTEVTLSRISRSEDSRKISINQNSGRIWSKVLKLGGVADYTVETPNSVATVRGTAFDSLFANTTSISVLEGVVNVTEKSSESSVELNENEAADVLDGIETRPVVEDDWISDNKARDEQFLQELNKRLNGKYWIYLQVIEVEYVTQEGEVVKRERLTGNFSNDQIQSLLNQIGFEIRP